MHADRPGDRPRLLYWYRTAPGIMQGRAALDEDAIRTIEEQHPGIDFDWPAIIALSEVMTPEDEAPPPRPPQQQQRREKKGRRDLSRGQVREEYKVIAEPAEDIVSEASEPVVEPSLLEPVEPVEPMEPPSVRGLVDELAGREISARLRARYAEIVGRIERRELDGAAREAWLARAEAIDPDNWESPEAVLQGVSHADALFEKLKRELGHSPRE